MPLMSQIFSSKTKNQFQEIRSWLYSFWKFTRPHTIIGTTLSVVALYLIALATLDRNLNSIAISQFLGAWLACLCGNIYITGLNQLEDVAIDRINKPHLPLAAAEFSWQTGKSIVVICGILALLSAGLLGFWLFATVAISLTIGTIYSLPPIRLKRFPFLAALCIFTVRGIIVNLGLFLHFIERSGRSEIFLTPAVLLLTAFILIFTVAIAIFKDIPDLEGDKQYNISTFTILLGKAAIFNLSRWIVTFCYFGMILAGILNLNGINPIFLVSTHVGLLVLLWWRSLDVNLEENQEIASFYQFIWKLFFLEYLIFPAACWLV